MRYLVAGVALFGLPLALHAQDGGAYRQLSPEYEVALASSAAPPEVSGDATILVLRGGRYEVAKQGSAGVQCAVLRTFPMSLEPICFDAEASRTILPITLAQVELRLEGLSSDEIDRRLDSMIESGELALPTRPAFAYMMSAGQELYANEDSPVGNWMPHFHIYWPYATAEMFGAPTPDVIPAVGNVAEAGKATASVAIVVDDFVHPEGGVAPGLAAAATHALSPSIEVEAFTPILFADDVAACIEFWGKLGIEPVTTVPEDGGVGFAILQYGELQLMYQSRSSAVEQEPRAAEGVDRSVVYVEVDSIDEILDALEDVEVVVPVRLTEYGTHELYVRDPAGNLIGFAQRGG